ncbi:hypothetical protein [Halobaculum sp. D14]|uniref:hypothetical protein n=1 Tax=Halobaculum sp. D14 TaxID=3421642 RepID=UPI003EB97384
MPRTATHVLLASLVLLAGVAAPVAADGFVVVTVDKPNEEPVPEEPFTLNVTVSNAEGSANAYTVTDLEILEGRNSSSEEVETKDVSERVAPGNTAELSIEPTLNETGTHRLYAHITLLEADGDRRRIVEPVSVTVYRPSPQLELSVEEAVAGAERSVNVTVANGLDVQLSQLDLTVSTQASNVTFGATNRVRAVLAAESAATFSFPAKAVATGRYPVTVTLRYSESGNRRTVTETFNGDFTAPQNPGRIRLTGVNVVRNGDVLAISGSAANLGGDQVSSVVVSVQNADGVTAAQPQPDYFVGTVDGSDFVSFDLNAKLTGDRTTVPIRVEYVVDGVQQSYTTEIQVGQEALATPEPADSGGSFPTLPALVGLAVVALAAVVLWLRR